MKWIENRENLDKNPDMPLMPIDKKIRRKKTRYPKS
jgi:hypothetical protein